MTTCTKCGDSGWLERPDGMVRCECKKRPAPPKLSAQEIVALTAAATEASHQLACIPEYPLEKPARQPIADALISMCASIEQIEYIVHRAAALYSHRRWRECGIAGLRQILLFKWPARDGINSGPETMPEGFPEGLPGADGLVGYDAEKQVIPQSIPRGLLLTSGDEAPVDLSDALQKLGEAKRLPPANAPLKNVRPITQADIDAAVAKRRKA